MTNKVIQSKITNPGIPTAPEHIFLGRAADGDVIWKPKSHLHTLVSGLPGSGKTVFLQNLAEQCRIRNWLVFVIDGDPSDTDVWMPGRNFESTNDLISSVIMLQEILKIMQNRYSLMEEEGVDHYADSIANLIPILVVIDSLDSLLEEKEGTFLSVTRIQYGKHISSVLASITRLGRASGVYVAVSSSSPVSELLNDDTLAIFGTRVSIDGSFSDRDSSALNESDDYSKIDSSSGKSWINVFGNGKEIELYGPVE